MWKVNKLKRSFCENLTKMSYYPTEEEEFEMLCNDELEMEREMERGTLSKR